MTKAIKKESLFYSTTSLECITFFISLAIGGQAYGHYDILVFRRNPLLPHRLFIPISLFVCCCFTS